MTGGPPGGYMGQQGFGEPSKGYVNQGMYNRSSGGYTGGPGGYTGRWVLTLIHFHTSYHQDVRGQSEQRHLLEQIELQPHSPTTIAGTLAFDLPMIKGQGSLMLKQSIVT